MQHSAMLMGSSILFLFIISAIEFVLFYPFKGKALDKSLLGLACRLSHYPKMNINHIPVLNHTLFSRHVHM